MSSREGIEIDYPLLKELTGGIGTTTMTTIIRGARSTKSANPGSRKSLTSWP